MLSSVVDRLLKALREVRPTTVRQFFALANQHMRWELNDLARRLDKETPALGLPEPESPARRRAARSSVRIHCGFSKRSRVFPRRSGRCSTW